MAKMRLTYYAVASFAAAGGVVVKAFNDRPNFYSAAVYLSQTPLCYMILANFALLCFGTLVYALQRLLFGELRIIERERLWERGWISITETLLIMMTFRDDVGGWFLFILSNLVVARIWAWIAEGRIEWLEQQPPSNPRLFHARLSTSLIVSCLFNSFFLKYCVDVVLEEAKPGMMVMFAFEFVVLTISSFSNLIRYCIALYEIRIVTQQTKVRVEARRAEIRRQRREAEEQARANPEEIAEGVDPLADLPTEDEIDENEIDVPGWEDKGRWVFALDILTDFLRLVVYLAFFSVLMIFHGIPVHIVRDVYITLQSFLKRIWSFYQYSSATKDMNTRYPDATAEELERENTCIVCREEMRPWPQEGQPEMEQRLRAKKLPCGHILHFGCLRSWLERQQVCPTCRRPVLDSSPPNAGTANQHPAPGGAVPAAAPGGAADQGQPPAPVVAPGQEPAQVPGQAPPPLAARRHNPFAQWRPRIFNLGPFRVAFGTMPANALNMLQQGELNGGEAGPAPAAPGAPAAPSVQAVAQTQLGHQPVYRHPRTLQSQLLQMDWELSRQITELNLTRAQIAHTRALQNELVRLRSVYASYQYNLSQPNLAAAGASTSTDAASSTAAPTNAPPGLVLPEGWTLIPLSQMPLTQTGLPSSNSATDASAATSLTAQLPEQSSSHSTLQPTRTVPLPGPASSSLQADSQTSSSASQQQCATAPYANGSVEPNESTASVALGRPDMATAQQSQAPAMTSPAGPPAENGSSAPTWNFGSLPLGSSQSSDRGENGTVQSDSVAESANGTGSEMSGKGKARAATVEDEAD